MGADKAIRQFTPRKILTDFPRGPLRGRSFDRSYSPICPTENTFGGDPENLPHQISYRNSAGTPISYDL